MDAQDQVDLPEPDVTPVEESPLRKAPRSTEEMLTAISGMVSAGHITGAQAARFRSDLGISGSYFTKATKTPAQRKQKRKAQKNARRRNR